MKPHMTNTDNPIDFPADSEVPRLLDPGCAERGCMGYDPFSGDTECVEFYSKDLVEKLQAENAALKKENEHLKIIHNYKGAGFK